MLSDKIYLWLVIISCLAFVAAGAICIIELQELQEGSAAVQPF